MFQNPFNSKRVLKHFYLNEYINLIAAIIIIIQKGFETFYFSILSVNKWARQ